MSAFVDTSKIEITDGTNTFYIKRRMDFGTRCRVEDTMTQMAMKNGAVESIQLTIGAQKLALAIHNIVGWKGPDFAGVACTPENIERLDPDYPLLLQAQERITALNVPHRDAVDPNSSTTTGGLSMTASEDQPVVAGIST